MLSEAMVIAAPASKFSAEKTGAATNISSSQITSLPTVSRSITDVTRLSPYGGNGMSFAGTDGRTANFTVDGATLHQKDPKGKDAFRLSSSGKEMGSLRGFYLRGGEPGKANAIAPYIIDGIRVGYSWESVVGEQTPISNAQVLAPATKVIENGQVLIRRGENTYNLLGTQL